MQFFRLVYLMAIGRRLDGIKILAPTMEAMGLSGLATASIDVCTKEIKKFFQVLDDPSNFPVLIHCTQGKDRTGLMVILLLFMLNVSPSAVQYDYLLSGPGLKAEMEERIKEIASIGLSKQFAEVPEGLVWDVRMHLENNYGGVNDYLGSIGVNQDMRNRIRASLSGN